MTSVTLIYSSIEQDRLDESPDENLSLVTFSASVCVFVPDELIQNIDRKNEKIELPKWFADRYELHDFAIEND